MNSKQLRNVTIALGTSINFTSGQAVIPGAAGVHESRLPWIAPASGTL
jgi:hypothetical protein